MEGLIAISPAFMRTLDALVEAANLKALLVQHVTTNVAPSITST